MKYHLRYHQGLKPIQIPQKASVKVLQPVTVTAPESLSKMFERALDDAKFVGQLRKTNPSSIAIAMPDDPQADSARALLPKIIEQVFQALPRIESPSVTVIYASGLKTHPDRETIDKILSSNIVRSCNVVVHAVDDARMKDFGTTHQGTPVRINAAYGEADFKIVTGLVQPHQFFGFTGGVKEAVVGCASAESIRHNHRLINEVPIHSWKLGDNPMRKDLDEAGRMVGIDFAVNVVLNPDREVVRVLAGNPESVTQQGAAACAAVYGIELDRKFDIILASCADFPKDISVYQASKSFHLLSQAIKHGGKILLLAAFQEDLGENLYFDYICPFAEPEKVSKDFMRFGQTMGARTADVFGGLLAVYEPDDLRDADSGLMEHCHLRAAEPSTIMEEWVADFEGTPQVAVIPQAATTYFY